MKEQTLLDGNESGRVRKGFEASELAGLKSLSTFSERCFHTKRVLWKTLGKLNGSNDKLLSVMYNEGKKRKQEKNKGDISYDKKKKEIYNLGGYFIYTFYDWM